MSLLELPKEMIIAGRVSKSYGTAGEIIVKLDPAFPEEYLYAESGAAVPAGAVPAADALLVATAAVPAVAEAAPAVMAAPAVASQPVLFIEFDGVEVPFTIERCTPKGRDGAIIKFTTVNDLAHAEELVRKELFADAEVLNPYLPDIDSQDDDISLKALVGFTLLDSEGQLAGTVSEFLDYPSNPCLEIVRPTGEIAVVPIHQDLIIGFNPENHQLQMEIPEGLFAL